MLLPTIFGENLFDGDLFDFRIPAMPDIDKVLYGRHAKDLMKTDVEEKDGNYMVSIDLPGFTKDEIHASLEDGYLNISAEKTMNREDKDEDKNYLRRERYAGSMSRSFYVGDSMKQEDINAEFKDGVLHLTMPKAAPEMPEPQTKYLEIK
ncbi:MAG: Hsp20/alpha crystallin family protein [Clostridia bacterium]|nr:Hsp20/alpha crystallin family protein [Clostridia bacterium]